MKPSFSKIRVEEFCLLGYTPCSRLKVNRRFGGTRRPHHHSRIISRAWKQVASRAFTLVSCSTYSSILNMEAICSSETSVDFQWTTRRYIPEDRTLHNHRFENLKLYKILYIASTGKRNLLIYQHFLGVSLILLTDCIEDMDIHIDCKFPFHCNVDLLFSHAMKLLGLIRTITFFLLTIDSLLMLQYILLWSVLNFSMFLLVGTLLRLLAPTNKSAYIENY
jgi:hypothetical protein